jgi:hypothetical protein
MRAFAVWAGIAVAISLNAEAQTPPPLLARASTPIAKFTSGEGLVPAIEKYKKEFYDRVYPEWLARVKAHEAELEIGIVRVRFTVTETGRIRDLRILSTGASRRLERLTLDAPRTKFSVTVWLSVLMTIFSLSVGFTDLGTNLLQKDLRITRFTPHFEPAVLRVPR